ncbi:MAG: AAA family ATPase [Chloroflexi bacterium]|nr:AAA family ATPase [Chloroflexota bacterium]
MHSLNYSVSDNVFRFPTDFDVELHLKEVKRDRYGHIHADARLVTPEGGVLALSHGDLESGHWRRNFAGQAAARNSGDQLRVENVLIEAVVALENDPAVPSQEQVFYQPKLLPVSHIIQSVPPPRLALVEGLYEKGTLQAIVAKPKVAKSLLVLGLAVTVSNGGGLWLDRKVTGGRVALFQLEDSARTISKRILEIASGQVCDQLLVHQPDTPFQINDQNYRAVVDACSGCSLVIIDPIIQASQVSDWNAASEVRAAYELWRRLARELDAVVVVVAHHRKQVGDFGDQIAGSIQGLATPDGIIELRRDSRLTKTQRKVSFVGRDWPDLEEQVIELDPETLRFNVVGYASTLTEDRKKQSAEQRADEVLDSLPVVQPGLSYSELTEKTGLGDKALRPALKILKEQDKIDTTGKSRSRINPLQFYRKT